KVKGSASAATVLEYLMLEHSPERISNHAYTPPQTSFVARHVRDGANHRWRTFRTSSPAGRALVARSAISSVGSIPLSLHAVRSQRRRCCVVVGAGKRGTCAAGSAAVLGARPYRAAVVCADPSDSNDLPCLRSYCDHTRFFRKISWAWTQHRYWVGAYIASFCRRRSDSKQPVRGRV